MLREILLFDDERAHSTFPLQKHLVVLRDSGEVNDEFHRDEFDKLTDLTKGTNFLHVAEINFTVGIYAKPFQPQTEWAILCANP